MVLILNQMLKLLWVAGALVIYIMFQRARMPKLPIITPSNKLEYPEWNAYLEKVYRRPVTRTYDLNTFTFFYHFSPLKVTPIQQHFLFLVPFKNRTNFAIKQNWSMGPESKIYKRGLLVTRELPELGEKMEVIRTRMPRADANFLENGEEKCTWFYHAIGSGMFIRCPQYRVLSRRKEFISHFGEAWKNDDDDVVHDLLRRHNIRCIAFNMAQLFVQKREIIVRLDTPDGSTCPIQVELENGKLCVCKDSDVMECF